MLGGGDLKGGICAQSGNLRGRGFVLGGVELGGIEVLDLLEKKTQYIEK